MTIQANTDLTNGSQTIPKNNVYMIASSNYLSAGDCITGTNQITWSPIGTNPGTILNKVSGQ